MTSGLDSRISFELRDKHFLSPSSDPMRRRAFRRRNTSGSKAHAVDDSQKRPRSDKSPQINPDGWNAAPSGLDGFTQFVNSTRLSKCKNLPSHPSCEGDDDKHLGDGRLVTSQLTPLVAFLAGIRRKLADVSWCWLRAAVRGQEGGHS
ncbi:hypothetical protein EYF80_023850 [Liparis tanakae]|uniref:Uncharacterized protein n=1 Tax=Liparis tanakae TaxID=230148 RepID=A0A4Z2HJM3_9TELE|nr:hypothetical protein EYF80_023850 [Liparis tanakae]